MLLWSRWTSLRAWQTDDCQADLPERKELGCYSASFLNRVQEFQQIGIDFILMRSRETVRPARIVNLLSALDELGGFLC